MMQFFFINVTIRECNFAACAKPFPKIVPMAKLDKPDWIKIHFFAADGLKEFMVGSYEEISAKMEEGTLNRTIASTNMNATSSRAHTMVGINFIQKTKNNSGKEMSKGATLNLVDLAGRYEKFTVTKCH